VGKGYANFGARIGVAEPMKVEGHESPRSKNRETDKMDNYLDKSFDDSFSRIHDLKYLPWVGKEYRRQKDHFKVLVIAESVYDWAEGSDESSKLLRKKDLVRRVVREHGLYFEPGNWDGYKNSPTYRNLERSIYGKKDIPHADLENLWMCGSLHQYVQRPMKKKNERPSAIDYQKGAFILERIIYTLKPRLCIFLGTDERKISPIRFIFCKDDDHYYKKINYSCPRVFHYSIDGKNAKMLMIKHTSRYFSWKKWHSKFLSKEASEYIEHMKARNKCLESTSPARRLKA